MLFGFSHVTAKHCIKDGAANRQQNLVSWNYNLSSLAVALCRISGRFNNKFHITKDLVVQHRLASVLLIPRPILSESCPRRHYYFAITLSPPACDSPGILRRQTYFRVSQWYAYPRDMCIPRTHIASDMNNVGRFAKIKESFREQRPVR